MTDYIGLTILAIIIIILIIIVEYLLNPYLNRMGLRNLEESEEKRENRNKEEEKEKEEEFYREIWKGRERSKGKGSD